MTVSFSTNPSNNDIFIGKDGNLVVVSGRDAVLAASSNVAKAQLGEMVLAINNGLPNFAVVWVGSPNIQIFESYLRTAIQSVPDVIEVTLLTVTEQVGVLSYTAEIETIYGAGVLNG